MVPGRGVCLLRAFAEFDVFICSSRKLCRQAMRRKNSFQASRQIERQLLLNNSESTGSWVKATVAGIDYDTRKLLTPMGKGKPEEKQTQCVKKAGRSHSHRYRIVRERNVSRKSLRNVTKLGKFSFGCEATE